MRRWIFLGLVLLLTLFVCACAEDIQPTLETPGPETPEVTTEESTEIVTETTAPAHSELYLPEYTTQQILEYFEEVVLRVEYTDGTGDTSLVQKWNAPICYRIYGNPTHEDLKVLTDLFTQLNTIPGFPGIYEGAEGDENNLTISFLEPDVLAETFAEVLNGEEAYGAVQFWYYTDTNEIYTANIGYRTDLDQTTRNSVLIEEIINMLGISDTELREDSIVYQYSNDNLALSDVDWVIVQLLYDPAIQCGMDYESCNAMIQKLYY